MPPSPPSAPIAVRPIAPDEWPQYRQVRLRALRDSPEAFGSNWEKEVAWPDATWAARIAAAACATTGTGLFAVKGGQVAGLVWCQLSDARRGAADIYQMWVEPGARGLGAGHLLLMQALAWAQSRGAGCVRLGVTLGDSPAMQLYLAHGFRAVGRPGPLREGSELMAQAMELQLEGPARR